MAFILLMIFLYGVKKICHCPGMPMSVAVSRQNGRSWSDHQITRGQNMSQPNDASVDFIILATSGLRPPPPAYHHPFIYPPEYQRSFAVGGTMERGDM